MKSASACDCDSYDTSSIQHLSLSQVSLSQRVGDENCGSPWSIMPAPNSRQDYTGSGDYILLTV
jgi:hypothetical protein